MVSKSLDVAGDERCATATASDLALHHATSCGIESPGHQANDGRVVEATRATQVSRTVHAEMVHCAEAIRNDERAGVIGKGLSGV